MHAVWAACPVLSRPLHLALAFSGASCKAARYLFPPFFSSRRHESNVGTSLLWSAKVQRLQVEDILVNVQASKSVQPGVRPFSLAVP